MIYCKKCVMPSTRPGIVFNKIGVCQACVNFENRINIDWVDRLNEFKLLCNKYRSLSSSGYDCIIAVSGGKDSHYQVHVMKEKMKMHPLLVSVEDNFPKTRAGVNNIFNISEEFGCDIISLKPNIRAQKATMRKTFEKYGKPTWYIDRLIYTYPLYIASKFGIPLVVYGENVSYEYGGEFGDESYSAKSQILNGVADDLPWDEILDEVVSLRDLSLLQTPSREQMDKLDPIYISYFLEWNSYKNFAFAKSRGFRDLSNEWRRTHHIEDFDQIDSRAYLVHPWMKYPKFGHATATDYASRFIRYGLITRDQGIDLVRKFDHNLDPDVIEDFIDFVGYSLTDFWRIVNSFYNKEIFELNKFGEWKLKEPIWAR